MLRITNLAFLLITCVFLGGCDWGLYVKVKTGGWVEGKRHEDTSGNARVFLGIPYAKAPVGELRFMPPVPVEKWGGLLKAKEFGPSCMQTPGALSAAGELSEDCLSLNVYTPNKADDAPVMVFIHGGAFVAGGSNQYDGWRLAQEYGAVVVTLNYRLGALGFLSHPELDLAMGAAQSGNMGLKDQQLALQWVQDNISAFGGDAGNVTVFGESAGSMSTCIQMVAPGSQDLAHKFIMQSAVCVGGLPVNTKEQSDALGGALASAFCAEAEDTLACLQSAPADALVAWGADAGIFGAGWSPTIVPESDILPASPVALIASGQYNPGPIMVGTNVREWGLFQLIGSTAPVSSIAEFHAYIDATFPAPITGAIKALYDPVVDDLANLKLIELTTDQVFRCPTRAFARLTSSLGSNVWLYSFEQGAAYHAMELAYVFGNPSETLNPVLNEPTRETIQSYWSGFAAMGTPNQDGQPEWPAYDGLSDQQMILKEASEAGFGLAQSTCDFWDSLAP